MRVSTNKQAIARFFAAAIVLVCLANLINDYLNGRWAESVIHGATAAFALGALLYLKSHQPSLQFSWLVAIVLIADCLYFTVTGTGNGAALFWVFFVPQTTIYFLGLRSGLVVIAATFVLTGIAMSGQLPGSHTYTTATMFKFATAFLFFSLLSLALEYARRAFEERLRGKLDRLRDDRRRLKVTLDRVDRLHGLLSMCAECKRIRDKDGDWHAVEAYVAAHSSADFSHTVCPECSGDIYPAIGSVHTIGE